MDGGARVVGGVCGGELGVGCGFGVLKTKGKIFCSGLKSQLFHNVNF